MNGLRKLFLILLLNYACFYDNPMLLVVMQGGSGTKCRTSRRLSVVLDIFH